MIYKLIFALAALYGVYQFFYVTNRFAKSILALQIAFLVLILVPIGIVKSIGLALFAVSLVMAVGYAFTQSFKLNKRLIIILSSGLVFLARLFQFQHYPGFGLTQLLCIIPVALVVWAFLNDWKSYGNEAGFLVITGAIALTNFLMFIS